MICLIISPQKNYGGSRVQLTTEIDFDSFFRLLKGHSIKPVFTFEPHDVDAFVETLRYINQHQDYFM